MTRAGAARFGLAFVVAVVTAACAGSSHERGSVRVGPVNAQTTNDAQSETWKSIGADVVARRQAGPAEGQPAFDTFGPYLSQPVDVTGNGDYPVVIGPLNAADQEAEIIPGILIPEDIKFDARADHNFSTFTGADGSTYGRLVLHVSNFQSEYAALTIWTK